MPSPFLFVTYTAVDMTASGTSLGPAGDRAVTSVLRDVAHTWFLSM